MGVGASGEEGEAVATSSKERAFGNALARPRRAFGSDVLGDCR
jgi:hypothetical protein